MKKILTIIIVFTAAMIISACGDDGGTTTFSITMVNDSSTKTVTVTNASSDGAVLLPNVLFPSGYTLAVDSEVTFNVEAGSFITAWTEEGSATVCGDTSDLVAGNSYTLTFSPDTMGCVYSLD